MARRMLVAGNWKMNGVGENLADIRDIVAASGTHPDVDVALCLPATLIHRAAQADPDFSFGGQDVHQAMSGSHTGCTSAAMLLDAGARLTIVGHSERRDAQHESDAEVKAKAEAGLSAGLLIILCIGESLAVREAGEAVKFVSNQLDASLPHGESAAAGIPDRLAIAYEPIWAIGTGKVPTVADIDAMHRALRQRLAAAYVGAADKIRILYGGSVKASNAAEIFAVQDVDGALVGGASLTAADFLPIVQAAANAG